MRFINLLILIFIVSSCGKKRIDPSEVYPPYRLIKVFSQKVKSKTDLILRCYGANNAPRETGQENRKIGKFSADFSLRKDKSDAISIELARELLIYLVNNFLEEINENNEVRSDLVVYPFTNRLLDISLYFEDENRIHLGQGVAIVYFSKGKIRYKGYNITQYRNRPPALGKHYTIHEESYEDALEIVKKQGSLTYLENEDRI